VADADFPEVLDGGAPQPPADWPAKQWFPIARDRVDDVGAVLCLQRVTATSFFGLTTIYERTDGNWVETFANGDQWFEPPTSPRPAAGRPFAMLTSTSGAGGAAFIAGVVTTAVAQLRVRSELDEHDVDVNEPTGAFVALSIQQPGAPAFTLSALDASGARLDSIEYAAPF
jgi:hypothetical protein